MNKEYCDNYYFSSNPKSAFVAHYDQGKKIKRKETFQCHYCHVICRYKSKFKKHIKCCTGRPGFIYCFQNESLETYEKYLKHKDFSFTIVGDLEATTGYISEIEGGSMFATFYCLMFNFHSELNMIPITCLRSLGQTEEEFKFITIPEKFYRSIDNDDLICFRDACDDVLQKMKKQAVSTLCMIEMQLCRTLKNILTR